MATYKEIHGVKVQYRDSDAPEIEGDVWYNSSTGNLKMYSAAGSWASGGNLNTARAEPGSSASGPQSATAIFGGNVSSGSPGYSALHEQYDGSSWTEAADLNVARSSGQGVGVQTAALYVLGNEPGTNHSTEQWNGTSWTAVADTNTAGAGAACSGTSTAAIKAGGTVPPRTVNAETWNGTSWTEGANLNTATTYAGGAGTSTAALSIAGQVPGSPYVSAKNESWNGTSWTEVNDLSTARYAAAGSFGVQTAALYVGGTTDPPNRGNSEEYDGVTWTEGADLSAARQTGGGSGTTSSGLVAGGTTGSITNATEEWTKGQNVEVITD